MHAAAVPEVGEQLAGVGMQGVHVLAALGDDAGLVPVRPVGDAAGAGPAHVVGAPVRRLHPAGLAGGHVEGLDEADGVRHVAGVAHDERGGGGDVREPEVRVHLEVGRIDDRPAPGDLELPDVVGRDLVEGRVLRAAEVGAEASPLAVHRPLLGERGGCRRQGGHGHPRNHARTHLQSLLEEQVGQDELEIERSSQVRVAPTACSWIQAPGRQGGSTPSAWWIRARPPGPKAAQSASRSTMPPPPQSPAATAPLPCPHSNA